ncbi:MAG TPA: UbiX family flavin prenyltransferase [Pyrinomonadaceae bacterium]|nr:UbiX family flavin prenyltransferase [Pyrinomonadaceae bacterium]
MIERLSGKLIVGITGATGTIFGVRLLQILEGTGLETHLVMSKWAQRTLTHETPYTAAEVEQMAACVYRSSNQGAPISSGSFLTKGMIIAPCSMRTLGAIASGVGDNLITRAADVTLKERRKLVLLVREAPFNDIHLENMLKLSRMGVVILPPVPAFYNHPKTIDDIVNHVVQRALDQVDIHIDVVQRWDGVMRNSARNPTDNLEKEKT